MDKQKFSLISVEARVYYFACAFLWDILAFAHDRITIPQADGSYNKWAKHHAALLSWLLEQQEFVVEHEQIPKETANSLLRLSEEFSGKLHARWYQILYDTAEAKHNEIAGLSSSLLLYYLYSYFLYRVLLEFESIMGQLISRGSYTDEYIPAQGLIQAFARLLEMQFLAQVDGKPGTDILAHIGERLASQLNHEYRQAVITAAQEFQLPDFS